MNKDERLLILLLILGGAIMLNRRSIPNAVKTVTGAVSSATNTAVAITLQNATENERKYAPVIADAEKQYGIPTGMLHRLIKAESAFRSDVISGQRRSAVGAVGIAQFMPTTAKDEGINPLDPIASIYGAARYLKKVYGWVGNDWTKAVAGYNWGAGNVNNASKKYGSNWLANAPIETKNYVGKIAV